MLLIRVRDRVFTGAEGVETDPSLEEVAKSPWKQVWVQGGLIHSEPSLQKSITSILWPDGLPPRQDPQTSSCPSTVNKVMIL